MSAPARLGLYALALAAALAVGAGIGAAAGPIDVREDPPATHEDEHAPAEGNHEADR